MNNQSTQLSFMTAKAEENKNSQSAVTLAPFPDAVHVLKCLRNSLTKWFLHDGKHFFSLKALLAIVDGPDCQDQRLLHAAIPNLRTNLRHRDRMDVETFLPLLTPVAIDALPDCDVIVTLFPDLYAYNLEDSKPLPNINTLLPFKGELLAFSVDSVFKIGLHKYASAEKTSIQSDSQIVCAVSAEDDIVMLLSSGELLIARAATLLSKRKRSVSSDTRIATIGFFSQTSPALQGILALAKDHFVGWARSQMYIIFDANATAAPKRPRLAVDSSTFIAREAAGVKVHSIAFCALASRSQQSATIYLTDAISGVLMRFVVSLNDNSPVVRDIKTFSTPGYHFGSLSVTANCAEVFAVDVNSKAILRFSVLSEKVESYIPNRSTKLCDGTQATCTLVNPGCLACDGSSLIFSDVVDDKSYVRLTTTLSWMKTVFPKVSAVATAFGLQPERTLENIDRWSALAEAIDSMCAAFDQWEPVCALRSGRSGTTSCGPEGIVSREVRSFRVYKSSILALRRTLLDLGGQDILSVVDFRCLLTLPVENFFQQCERSRIRCHLFWNTSGDVHNALSSLSSVLRRLNIHCFPPIITRTIPSATVTNPGKIWHFFRLLERTLSAVVMTLSCRRDIHAICSFYGKAIPQHTVRANLKSRTGTVPLYFSWTQRQPESHQTLPHPTGINASSTSTPAPSIVATAFTKGECVSVIPAKRSSDRFWLAVLLGDVIVRRHTYLHETELMTSTVPVFWLESKSASGAFVNGEETTLNTQSIVTSVPWSLLAQTAEPDTWYLSDEASSSISDAMQELVASTPTQAPQPSSASSSNDDFAETTFAHHRTVSSRGRNVTTLKKITTSKSSKKNPDGNGSQQP
jgi:hypothetical protein